MCWDCASFDFHPTLASVLGPTLRGHEVVEVRQPREKHLLVPFGVMEAFHREQLPLDGVMGLIQQGLWPGSVGPFVEQVVPLLQHRGVARKEYRASHCGRWPSASALRCLSRGGRWGR